MKHTVENAILGAVETLKPKWEINELPRFEVESPKIESHGDLATNLAMLLAKPLKRAPRQIAKEIVEEITKKSSAFEFVQIAGPGFINFRFSNAFWHENLYKILREDRSYLRRNIGKGKKVQVEFVSANPTGPLHIGHGRGAAVGLALSNLLEAAGYKVEREFYINDAGRQVGLLGLSVYVRYQQILGSKMELPDNAYQGVYIGEAAEALIAEAGEKYRNIPFDKCGEDITDWSYKRMLAEIKTDLEDFGIRFDTWKSEKSLYAANEVQNALDALKTNGYLYEHDQALWFKSSSFKDDDKDRVVVKQDGEYTYFASDIAYHKDKLDRGYDCIIDIWGADHHGYIARISAVLQAFGYDKEKFQVILVQIVSLLRKGLPVKMSKRSGEFITLREVVDEVGADITKFIFLTRRSDSHLDFDIETAKQQSSENPVFYVQYAHARINSIFRQAPTKGFNDVDRNNMQDIDVSRLTEPEELGLIKKLCLYPMIFEAAALAYEPHRITFYLQELAGLFHSYYRKHRILVEDDRDQALARMTLARAVEIVLYEGLTILGVRAPEEM